MPNIKDEICGGDTFEALACASQEGARRPSGKYEDMFCLASVVEWWESLPPRLRQDIEGSGAEPGCIAKARRLVAHYKKHG
jgi:hypothetical protein